MYLPVVICLKIRTFVVSATTYGFPCGAGNMLWFAWKFVPLWYQQQRVRRLSSWSWGCDLLENSYLCGISNNSGDRNSSMQGVVICLKIRTFVVSATTIEFLLTNRVRLWFAWKFVPLWYQQQQFIVLNDKMTCCDLLENSYLCGISNNLRTDVLTYCPVVICLKIRTFVVSATTTFEMKWVDISCDLLENSYLCGISNNAILYITSE